MRKEHKKIQRWIKKNYSARFEVLPECVRQNRLLLKGQNCWYQPDVILKSLKRPNDIRYIIEVENDPMRKAIVGACLLADCYLEKKQDAKAGMIFIVYSKQGKRQVKNFRDKIKVIKHRLRHLSSIQVVTEKEFKQGRGFEIRLTRNPPYQHL